MGRVAGRKKEAVARLLRPIQLGGHELLRSGEEWRCTVCNKASRAWNKLAGRVCKGAAAGVWAKRAKELGGRGGSDGAGHVRAAKGGVVWCVKCGSYAVRWAVGLAEPCRERPTNPSQRRVLARLKAGRHPRSNKELEGALLVEVPGLQLARTGGEREQRAGSSGMVGERGKLFVGYARRPGGMGLIVDGIDGGSQASGEGEGEVGPRRAYFERRKRMRRVTAEEEAGDGGVRARQRAAEARVEESRVTRGLVERWSAVLAGATAAGRQGTQGSNEGGMEGSGREVGDEREQASMTRKELIGRLNQAVQQRRGKGSHGGRVEERIGSS